MEAQRKGQTVWGDSTVDFSASRYALGSEHHGMTTPSRSSHAIASASDMRPKQVNQNEVCEAQRPNAGKWLRKCKL